MDQDHALKGWVNYHLVFYLLWIWLFIFKNMYCMELELFLNITAAVLVYENNGYAHTDLKYYLFDVSTWRLDTLWTLDKELFYARLLNAWLRLCNTLCEDVAVKKTNKKKHEQQLCQFISCYRMEPNVLDLAQLRELVYVRYLLTVSLILRWTYCTCTSRDSKKGLVLSLLLPKTQCCFWRPRWGEVIS